MQPNKNKPKNKNKNLLRLSAILSALGAGSYAFGRGLVSPETQASMDRFKAIDFTTPKATLLNYATMGSDLMNQDLFYGAMKPIDFMRTMRSFPVGNILASAGVIPPEFKGFNTASEEHYGNFALGPLHGIAKALDETLSGTAPHGTPEKEKAYAEAMERTRSAINNFIQEKTGLNNYFNRNLNENIAKTEKGEGYPIWNITRYKDMPTMDRQQQTQLALLLPDWLKNNKEFKDVQELYNTASHNVRVPAKSYRQILVEPLEAISSKTKMLGAGLGLVGAGLGAYGLYKHFQDKKKKKLENEKDKTVA